MRTRAQIIERALLHVGHRELSSNDSPLIRAWLRRCGVLRPAPWCAAFASWCIEEREGTARPGADGRPNQPLAKAGAQDLGRLLDVTGEPEPGDLMWFPTGAWTGHCGIVVHVEGERVLCVEGNQANAVRFAWRRRDQVRFSRTREESWLGDIYPPAAAFSAPLLVVTYEGTR